MNEEKKAKPTSKKQVAAAVPTDDAVVVAPAEMHSPVVPILVIVIPMILLVAYAMFLD